MATFTKLSSGHWRVQIRRKGRYATNTFLKRKDADEWAIDTERSVDRDLPIKPPRVAEPYTFADLIDLHVRDLLEAGKPIRRSKRAVLEAMKLSLGKTRYQDLTRQKLIEFGRKRAKAGAGPATLAIDISFIGTVLTHAAAVHEIPVVIENVKLARVALGLLGLVGKGHERDRRPTQDELDTLIAYVESNPQQYIPLGRIIRFAVATAMRLDEICSVEWSDVDFNRKTLRIRNRKDPRKKDGNHQTIPLLNITGYDAWEIVLAQRIVTGGRGRVFPHHGKSTGTAFHRACEHLAIEDLRFHDLRHEGTSRLFEAGLTIEKVALVSGHKDWRMLRRYTNLKPEDLLQLQSQPQLTLEEFVAKLAVKTV